MSMLSMLLMLSMLSNFNSRVESNKMIMSMPSMLDGFQNGTINAVNTVGPSNIDSRVDSNVNVVNAVECKCQSRFE